MTVNQQKIVATLDWVGFTVPSETDIYALLGIPFENFIADLRGNMGYSKMAIYGNIKVYYEGRIEMGTHVEMTGKGCREFEGHHKDDWLWIRLFNEVFQNKGKFTRCDVALDDYHGFLNMNTIKRKVKSGLVRSNFKSGINYEVFKLADGSKEGHTVYFGSPNSRIRVRIYDKRMQQIESRNKQDAGLNKLKERLKIEQDDLQRASIELKVAEMADNLEELNKIPDHWVRTEIQARDERANSIAWCVRSCMEIKEIVSSVLRNYIAFCEPSPDQNKSRWLVSPWWDEFLNYAESLSLSLMPETRTRKKVKEWVSRQVAPTLASMCIDKDGNVDFEDIHKLVFRNLYRLKDKHKLDE